MPVHEGQRWLDPAIESILAQTFSDLELVALDDGSTDSTWDMLQSWAAKDHRVRTAQNPAPSGVALSSNIVVAATDSPIVARMDADDVAHPDRLRQQFEALQGDPAIVLVGTLSDGIDGYGRRVRPRDRGRLLREGPFAPFPHGSIMFRRDAFDTVGGYREEAEGFEDLDLFLRLAQVGKIAVIPEALYSYRYHMNNTVIALPTHEREAALAQRNMMIAETRQGVEMLGQTAQHVANEVFLTSVAMCVWAGVSPRRARSFDTRVLKGSRSQVLRSVLYASWGSLHPRSLRAAIATLVSLRDKRATRKLTLDGPLEWRFGS